MNDSQFVPIIEAWLLDTDPIPPEPLSRSQPVMSRVSSTRQLGRRWPPEALVAELEPGPMRPPTDVPPAIRQTDTKPRGIPTMFSATKFVVAGVIVALFGGFLVISMPFEQQGARVPVAATDATGQDVADQTARSARLRVFVTATGGQPPSEWDAETLVERITDGSATVDEVRHDPEDGVFPTWDIVVANREIDAGDSIEPDWLSLRTVPIDETTAHALRDPTAAVGSMAAVDILEYQPVTPNLLVAEATEPQ